MYARTTLLEIDTLRVSLEDADAQFRAEVLPHLQELPGFCGVYGLATPEGRAMLISFWETEDQAAASDDWYQGVLTEFATLFRSPPGRERYEVRIAVPPPVAVPATG